MAGRSSVLAVFEPFDGDAEPAGGVAVATASP
jgi:hypothetical protein